MKLAGVIALLAPGQGAQTPGMLTPWLAEAGADERALARWSAAVDLDLERLGTTADAEEIQDTAVTQPLVVATALLAHAALAACVDLPRTARGARGTRSVSWPPPPSPACSPRTRRWRSPRCGAGRWRPRARWSPPA